MSDVSPRLGMAIPEGSTGDDDFVLVKEHVSDNLLLLEGGLGFYHVANFAALPVTGNFKGRLAFLDDTESIYRYNGTAWSHYEDTKAIAHTPGPIGSPGGDLVLGNAVQSAYYRRFGAWCHYHYEFTMGNSGFNGRTGGWSFPLPFPCLTNIGLLGGGWVHVGNLAFFAAQPRANAGTNYVHLYVNAGTANGNMEVLRNATHPAGGPGTGIPLYPGDFPFSSARSQSEIYFEVVYRYR